MCCIRSKTALPTALTATVAEKNTFFYNNFNVPTETNTVIKQRWVDGDYNTGLFGEPRLGAGAFCFYATPYYWNFGDGTTSTDMNPSHIYTDPGTYTVTKTVAGTFVEEKIAYIDVGSATVTADFTASPLTGLKPLTVDFTDLSLGGPAAWLWNFGDLSDSTIQNPSHVYASAGNYTVSLTVSADNSSIETKTNYINVIRLPLTTNFTAEPQVGLNPMAVQFTDLSLGYPDSFTWEFGDGTVSREQYPEPHTYVNTGFFDVALTADTSTEIKPSFIVSSNFTASPSRGQFPLTVNFKVYPTPKFTYTVSNLTVDFTNATFGALTYDWDFGDGSHSSLEAPRYTYADSALKTVSLKAYNGELMSECVVDVVLSHG